MGNLVDKYLAKKSKNIFTYSKSVKDMISFENPVWSKETEFNECLKNTINMYIKNYYFKPLDNFDDFSKFFGPTIKCDNKFKTVFSCVYENFDFDNKDAQKESLYLITLVTYIGIILDKFTYPYKNYLITMETVEAIIKPMFDHVSFASYKPNDKALKELSRFIRKNSVNEKKFFEAIGLLNSDNSRNEYQSIDENDGYYKILYKYKIDSVEDYSERELRHSFSKISNGVKVISFELMTLTALKLLILEKDIGLLYPVDLLFYDKDSELNKLIKITENKSILDKIYILVNYEDYKKNRDILKKIKNNGFNIAFNVEDAPKMPYMAFQDSNLIFINKDFIKENEANFNTWKEIGIKFCIKKNGDVKNEKSLLGLEE